MSDRNKIAQALTVEELDAFVSELAGLPGKERTLEAIKRQAALRGITISLMSAAAFRDVTFERHLKGIRRAQETAAQVESIASGGSTMADASAQLLAKRIFEQLVAAEDEDSAAEVDVGPMALAVSRLRSGDVQRKALEQKLKESEAKLRRQEEAEAAKARAASAEMEKLRKPDGDLSQSERAAIVAKVDEILGIKKG